MNRTIRNNINTSLTVTGMVVVLTTAILGSSLDMYTRFIIVVLGIAVLVIGVWGIANKVLPSDRKFNHLREEAERMIELIRQLNAAAIIKSENAAESAKFDETVQEMHHSVTRMSECAADQR